MPRLKQSIDLAAHPRPPSFRDHLDCSFIAIHVAIYRELFLSPMSCWGRNVSQLVEGKKSGTARADGHSIRTWLTQRDKDPSVAHRGNPCRHMRNMQTPLREGQKYNLISDSTYLQI